MTYTEAIEIRLRAAQRQYVSAEELAQAHKVVAYTRASHRTQPEPQPILVEPCRTLPFIPEPPAPEVKAVIPIVQPVPQQSRCAQRCDILGLCQWYVPCLAKNRIK